MVKIYINNSTCQLKDVPKEAEQALREALKYHQNLKDIAKLWSMVESRSFSSNRVSLIKRAKALEYQNEGMLKNLYKILYQDGTFPTGLLPKALQILKDCNLTFEIKDERKKPQLETIKYVLREQFPQLRYYQRASSRLAKENGRGIIVAPTGTGKTLTVARMIWELGLKTVVITPSKSITDNMVDTLRKYFGKGKVDKLNTKTPKLKKDINVVNIQAMVRIKPEVFNDVDMVIIDEFHHSAAETYQEVNLNHLKNCYYRIGVTATNFRNDGSDLALEGVLSEVLYEYSIPRAIKDGFLIRPTFEIVENDIYVPEEERSTYQAEYKSCIVHNENRNQLIADIAHELLKENASIIILVQQLEHGESLKTLIPEAKFLHGEEKDSVRQQIMEDYRQGQIRCLIGTSVIGEGVDLPIANTLILAGGGKSRIQVMQNIGRVLRPFKDKTQALVIDFTDDGTSYSSKHHLERCSIYDIYDEVEEDAEV